MNSGIRDAHNLGWKLAKVVAGHLGPAVLDTYQAERAPHARSLIEFALRIGQVMMPTSHAQAFLVQTGLRFSRPYSRAAVLFRGDVNISPSRFIGAASLSPACWQSVGCCRSLWSSASMDAA